MRQSTKNRCVFKCFWNKIVLNLLFKRFLKQNNKKKLVCSNDFVPKMLEKHFFQIHLNQNTKKNICLWRLLHQTDKNKLMFSNAFQSKCLKHMFKGFLIKIPKNLQILKALCQNTEKPYVFKGVWDKVLTNLFFKALDQKYNRNTWIALCF